jgi:hypothetical protein
VRKGGNSNGPAEPLYTSSPMRFLICKNMVYEANGYIIIQVTKNFDYDIAIEQINKDGLEFWLRHLQEKRWFTPKVEQEFIKVYSNT